MSGRNLRDFVISHRTQYQDGEEQKHLVTRMMMGMDSNRYKKINYEEAREAAFRFKDNAVATGARLNHLKNRARIGKERQLVKQHYPIWRESHKELRDHLRGAEYAYQSDFSDLIKSLSNIGYLDYASDLEQCDSEVDAEIKKFSQAIIMPIQQLINDLKIRLHRGTSGPNIHESLKEDVDDIMNEIDSVKSQSLSVGKWLSHQQMILEGDLEKADIISNDAYPSLPPVESALPVGIVLAECPDTELKSTILRQFIDLHTNYNRRLKEELARLQGAESLFSKSKDKSWIFSVVYDLYHRHILPQSRENLHFLIIDMLAHLISKNNKSEILEMESHFLKQRYSKKHCELLVTNYNRDFGNLISNSLSAFAEARHVYANADIAAKDRAKQRKICAALHEKVISLRAKQEEILQLEAELEERSRRKHFEEEEKRQWLENERRYRMKKEITKYQRQRKAMEQQKQMEQEKRLQILKSELENQRKIDQERVNYRAGKIKERNEIQAIKLKAKIEDEILKKQRLDNLRQTVAVEAEFDPERLVADTISSKARQGIGTNEEVSIQAPLFDVHGYSQKQIEGDVRLRVEAALRNAGIHESEYARRVLSNIPPPTQPRRDTDSSALQYMFKN
uniref:coiled-coil domain-containing protein 148-like n=1 Tax=Styela clava TaxID=7725 RepID=UPI001939534E|nr:coiled-coil domain-containing protein 148-like [Styela clava]